MQTGCRVIVGTLFLFLAVTCQTFDGYPPKLPAWVGTCT